MTADARLLYDRGTLVVPACADPRGGLPGVLWDERTMAWRAPAHRYAEIVARVEERRAALVDDVAPRLRVRTGPWTAPALRDYQRDALGAWEAFGRRGVVVLPTGAGKTRVAIAALAKIAASAIILVPTRALLCDWDRELRRWYGGPIGLVGDGARQVEDVTLVTFASAYRHLDAWGDRFAVLVADEVHHFEGGLQAEALEVCPAPARLGLTATAPARGSAEEARLADLVGPIVCEIGLADLVGSYLAPLDFVHLRVPLEPDERDAYERAWRPFSTLRAAWLRANPEGEWADCLRALARSEDGRAAIRGFHAAAALASFPRAKRRLVRDLLARHRDDKTLVFTARADDAYAVSTEHLVPAITAETSRAERDDVLARFRDGRLRTIVSARVLNEGIDVPDASVAIVAGGELGGRELVQRIGRVLRPGPGKRAVAYELVTAATIDDTRARARRRHFAARFPGRV